MKKKFFGFLLLALAVLLPFNANAKEVSENLTLSEDVTDGIVVKSGSDVTLNLGGHNISTDKGDTIVVEKDATLTITGNGKVTNNINNKTTLFNSGKTIIDGGTFERINNDSNSYYTIVNHGDMIVKSRTIRLENGNSSIIDNGWVNGNENVSKTPANLTINGGTIEIVNNDKYIKNDDFGVIVVNGGTFNGDSKSSALIANVGAECKLTVNGGTFNMVNKNQPIWVLKGEAKINGGVYNLPKDSLGINDGGELNTEIKKYDVIGSSNGEQIAVNEKDLKDIVVVNESTLSSDDEKLVNDAIKNNYTVVGSYNIDLFKGLNDQVKVEQVLENNEEVAVTVPIPSTIKALENGYKRTYYIIRVHNGKTDILNANLTDDNKITFKTDKFSSFTLAYVDEKVENTTQIENPNTSDKALIYGVISLIGLSGLVYTAKVLKKRS